jgi:hypothetical protein
MNMSLPSQGSFDSIMSGERPSKGSSKARGQRTRVSCHRFRANERRSQLSLLAYNLGKLCRRLVLLKRIDS